MLKLQIMLVVDSQVKDLTGLEHATQLVVLGVHGGQIRDLRPLTGLTQLLSLGLSGHHISDLRPLAGLTGLRELFLDDNQISDISSLTQLTQLEVLYLNKNRIGDIRPLAGLTQLTELVLSDNQIINLIPLARLTQLTELVLSGNQIRHVGPLSRLTQLEELYLWRNQISDLQPLVNLTQLTRLILSNNQIRDVVPLSRLTQLTRLTLSNNQIRHVGPLARLTQLNVLTLGNNQIQNVAPLAGLTKLTDLQLVGNPIHDTSPLASLTQLNNIDIRITAPPPRPRPVEPEPVPPRGTDLIPDGRLAAAVRQALGLAPNAPITKQAMERLTVLRAGSRQIKNLTGLEHATQLEELSLGHNQISDISPLAGLTQLRRLFLGRNQISDVSPLAGLTRLRELSLSQNDIRDVSPLTGLVNLQRLWLAENPITDTSPLASLTKLVDVDIKITTPVGKGLIPDSNLAAAVREELDLVPNASITKQAMQRLTFLAAVNSQITSLTGLEHATELKTLLIPQNQIRDINPLSGLTNLTDLSLGSNQISDIRPLTGLTQLERLALAANQIRDVRPLAGLTQLERLYLYDNQISDVSPLAGLTRLKELQLHRNDIGNVSALARLVNLEKLVLADNQISDVRPLAGLTRLKELWLHRNEIRDVSALVGLVNLEWLGLTGNPITDTSPLSSLTKLVEVDVQIPKSTSVDASVDVLIYTGGVWWITRSGAISEAETTKSLLQAAGIHAEITENENYVKQWMQQTTSDGSVDVLILYGPIPTTIYPPGNTMPDGSVAENWIETPDGNTILNHADYFGFWSTGNINLDGQVGERNGGGTLRNLMDIPNISISIDRDNIPMSVTTDGSTLTPSLVDFQSDRPFPLNHLQGDWFAEKILASNTGNMQATLADPVVVRDGDRGRIAIVHQTSFKDNPKGEVAAEIIINYLLADPVVSISPSPVISPAIGEQLTFNLNITAGKAVAGYQVTVQFDATALRYVESSNADYLPTGAFFVPPVVNGNRVKLAATALTGVSNGDGTLATLTFEVVAAKASMLPVSDVILSDSEGNGVSPQVEGGQVTEPVKPSEDVNGDGVVNIQDLVLVASRLGQAAENADVNGDGVVNIQDLVKVAGALGNAVAAPSLHPHAFEMFTAADLRHWLSQAQHLSLTDPASLQGILFLEQLLAVLIPKETALLANYPNPFNPETWIPYQLAKPADVTLTIYAVNGQVVRRLSLGYQLAGTYQSRSRAAYWDGRNALGEPVASGLYFYTLTVGDFTATRKMLIRK